MKKHLNNLPLISVIIPCRNEKKFIAECLNSLIKQTYLKELTEILVIDGKSEDKTRKIIKKYSEKYPFIKLLDNFQKIKPIALNIGINKSNGEYIIIMDAHAKYQKNYISRCVDTLIKYKADNVGGILKTMPNKNTISAKAIAVCLSSFFGVGGSHFRKNLNKITEVDTVFGGCYKRDVFKKIGLFNERLIRSQDIEFNIRLKKAGGKIILNPEIISYYYPKSTLKSFFKHCFLKGLWIVYVPKLTKTPLRLRHYAPLALVLSILLPLILSLLYSPFTWISLFILATYSITSLCFSLKIALKEKNIVYFFLMPIVFACRHFGHGFGSFWALFTKPKQNKVYR